MQNYTAVFHRLDKIQEAEDLFVARAVGNFLCARLPAAFEEADEAIAKCQDWFVHTTLRSLPLHVIAHTIALEVFPDSKATDKRQKLADDICYTANRAQQQFRQYLPYIARFFQ